MPLEAGIIEKGDLTIEHILEEKKTFDLNVRFERFGIADDDRGWTVPGISLHFFLDDSFLATRHTFHAPGLVTILE